MREWARDMDSTRNAAGSWINPARSLANELTNVSTTISAAISPAM